jgi:ppGpp synthetase/RelA/SpoT-type nucleotidyltranferase
MPVLEKNIFEIVKNNITLNHIWKAHYLIRFPLYERLCIHIRLLLNYICREENIKVLDITYRVKDFESFYNRAVDRFNYPDKFKIPEGAAVDEFRKNFISGAPTSVDSIFSKFFDLSGMRILCVYKNDVEKIRKQLCGTDNANNLEDLSNPFENTKYGLKVNFLNKNSDYDYRAEHFILKLGDERTMLVELKELVDILCEVQVKTILSQGWSDADHDLFYKSNLPQLILNKILLQENPDFGIHRRRTSDTLNEVDDKFVKLKDSIIKLLENENFPD